jgi:hypothetical protein
MEQGELVDLLTVHAQEIPDGPTQRIQFVGRFRLGRQLDQFCYCVRLFEVPILHAAGFHLLQLIAQLFVDPIQFSLPLIE